MAVLSTRSRSCRSCATCRLLDGPVGQCAPGNVQEKASRTGQIPRLFINGGQDEKGNPVDGALARGVSLETAGKIFDEVMAFAGYAFNKSHAAAYAVVAYQTGWLKVHYPVELMAAMLNSYLGSLSQAASYVRVCRAMNIAVLPPDINRSQARFTTENGAIRFALAAVKNVARQRSVP
jgi:DNA polymerase-3 subunit alpha